MMSRTALSSYKSKAPPFPNLGPQIQKSRCHPRFSGQRPWQEDLPKLRPLDMPIGVALAIALFVLKYPQYIIWFILIFFMGYPWVPPTV